MILVELLPVDKMAKIRTKEAKIQARLHRSNLMGNSPVNLSQNERRAVKVSLEEDTNMLLGYPITLLYRDFGRSLAITLILVVVLLGIFLFFRYN